MEELLSNEYWKKRCELAEKVIETTKWHRLAVTPDLTKAFDTYHNYIKSPTDTALYTDFADLLKANDMRYEFFEPDDVHALYELRFGKKETNLKHGCVISATNAIEAFEWALEELKTIIRLNTKSQRE